jgi:serine/threonine protein kinase
MQPSLSGATLGAYRLGEELGAGNFGRVLDAEDTRSGARVAVKILHRKWINQPDGRGGTIADRFIWEARVLQRLNHPGVVQVLDVIDHRGEGEVGYVMEHLFGRDLSKLGKELPLVLLLELMAGVADALQAVHDVGIIHRDVKLSNIFICDATREGVPQRRVKVIDFGIAKDLANADGAPQTAMGLVVGTPSYMAPECFRRIHAPGQIQLTPAVDQWSFGIALYRLLSGKAPFSFQLEPAMFGQLDTLPHRPLRLHDRFDYLHAPDDLVAIVDRCLAKDPADRFPSMSVVAEALREASASLTQLLARDELMRLLLDLPSSFQELTSDDIDESLLDDIGARIEEPMARVVVSEAALATRTLDLEELAFRRDEAGAAPTKQLLLPIRPIQVRAALPVAPDAARPDGVARTGSPPAGVPLRVAAMLVLLGTVVALVLGWLVASGSL